MTAFPAWPSDAALEAAVAQARASTTVDVQRAVARLLGATPEVADAAVAAVAERGALGHGIALAAAVLASRRGCDPAAALAAIAGGEAPPSSWSDFELRSAASELAQDAESARARRAGGAAGAVVDLPAVGAPLAAVDALAHRAAEVRVSEAEAWRASGLPLAVVLVEYAWVRALVASAGGRVVDAVPGDAGARALTTAAVSLLQPRAATSPLPEDVASASLVVRRRPYLDPFAA